MFVHDFIRNSARTHPDKTALIDNGREFTFRSIDEDSDRLAAEFQRLGVGRGDRVAAMLENSVEMVIALWAALKAGAVFMPINSATKGGTLDFIVKDAEAKCLVVHPKFRQDRRRSPRRSAQLHGGYLGWRQNSRRRGAKPGHHSGSTP